MGDGGVVNNQFYRKSGIGICNWDGTIIFFGGGEEFVFFCGVCPNSNTGSPFVMKFEAMGVGKGWWRECE